MQTAGIVTREWDDTLPSFRPSEIMVDSIGIGAGVANRLSEQGLPIREINVAETGAMGSGREELEHKRRLACPRRAADEDATFAEKNSAAVDRLRSTHSSGSWTVKRAPSTAGPDSGEGPGFVRFSAHMRPRCASMICLVIDRPRPEFWPKSPSSPRSV